LANLLARLAAIAGAIIAIFFIGNLFGKKSQKIKQLEEDFTDAIEAKNAKKIAVMMILLLFASGCANTSANSFCLWAKPITVSQEEYDQMSDETFRQIDNFNQEFEARC